MTRLRLPAGLSLASGVYDVVGEADEARCIGIRDAAGLRVSTPDWDELREVRGVEIECSRHPGQWWSTSGKTIAADTLRDWRCPDCAWAFRRGLGSL
jgi:hypothetical protein